MKAGKFQAFVEFSSVSCDRTEIHQEDLAISFFEFLDGPELTSTNL
jgi:hypothetical protein